MLERLKTHFDRVKEKVTSHILVLDEPEHGVEFGFVFGGEYATEEWEEAFSSLKEGIDKYKLLGRIIKKANNRTQEERVEFVDALTSPKKGILIEKDAKKRTEMRRQYEQLLININSMSETNLANMQKAIDNLQKS